MFQFSDDIDEDILEDVLSVSTSRAALEETTNILNNDSNDRTSITNVHSVANESCITLDEFDDDDLILSVCQNENHSTSDDQVTLPLPPNVSSSRTSFGDDIHSSQVAHSSKTSAYFASPNFSLKHKTTYMNETPIMAKCSKIEYERKFPGPAGLIAKKATINENTVPISEKPISSTKFEVHQTGDSFFDSSPWQELLRDVKIKSNQLHESVMQFTISNIKRLNFVKNTSWKIPVLAAVIFNLDSSVSDPSITLKDPSGEIRGTLHKDLWEQLNHLLTVGSALLLRQVSVVSMINSRKVYLNITKNNVVTVYTPPSDGSPTIVTLVTEVSETNLLNDIKTDRSPNSGSVPDTNEIHATNCLPPMKARSNAELLNLIKNSNSTDSCITKNTSKSSPARNFLTDLNSNSMSSSSIANAPLVKPQLEKKIDAENNNSSLIFSELEGVDADSLFDDF